MPVSYYQYTHRSVNSFFLQNVTIKCPYCDYLLKYVQIITISDMYIFPQVRLHEITSAHNMTLGVYGPCNERVKNNCKVKL